MDREPLSIVIVAPEKDVKTLGTALKSLARKAPVRMHYATQAIEGPSAFSVALFNCVLLEETLRFLSIFTRRPVDSMPFSFTIDLRLLERNPTRKSLERR